jgi:membrane protease YdiL (CAAX protease family)
MKSIKLTSREWVERVVLALVFLVFGFLIYIVFSPFRPLLPRIPDYLGRISLIVLLLAATLLIRRNDRYGKYYQVFLGLLIMAIAVSLDNALGIYLDVYLGVNGKTPIGYAIMKFNEFAVVVSVVVSLTLLTGGSLDSIYIQKGKLKSGLTIGLISLLIAAAGSIPMSFLFKAQNLNLERILAWLPWIMIFVLANAAQEELLFRGLFLRKLQPFFGKFLSNLMIAFVFTLLHGTVNYTIDNYVFLAVVFPLALGWGYVMQKTDSLWGSILWHAGMDIPIMLGIFSNLV